jgi:hypothetical protein
MFAYYLLPRRANIFRIRRTVQDDGQSNGKTGTVVEVQARVTNDEGQDRETASYAYALLERLASLAGKNPAPSESNFARETASPSAAKPMLVKSRPALTAEGSLLTRSSQRSIA